MSLLSAELAEGEPFPSLALGAPFPASWSPLATVLYSSAQARRATDGGTPATFWPSLAMADVPAAFSGPITPKLTPVVAPLIQGRDFLNDQAGVTVTPTVSWRAPTTGVAVAYRLSITRLNGTSRPTDFWRILTPNTSVTVPGDILVAGSAYVLELQALSSVGVGVPYAGASVVSGVVRP